MKNINKYNNIGEYNADDNRPSDENTVSLISATDEIKRGIVNVILGCEYASIGDTVVWDNIDDEIKVVKLGSLNKSKLDISRYIISGTVAYRKGDKI